MSVLCRPEAISAVKPAECHFGTAHLDDALTVLAESGA
jgi:hypothetical protein